MLLMIPKLPDRARGTVFRLAVALYLLASSCPVSTAIPIDNGLVDSEFIKGQRGSFFIDPA